MAAFDFGDLDAVDGGEAQPEWLRWRAAETARPLAVLEDVREEQFAAGDEEYVFERLEVPILPESGAYDPMGLADDSTDAVEDRIATVNGQVIVKFMVVAYEDHMGEKLWKEERLAAIEELHNQRLEVAEAAKQGRPGRSEVRLNDKAFDRKQFGWREIQTPLLGYPTGMPDGGAIAEFPFQATPKFIKALTRVRGVAFIPTAVQLQIVAAMGGIVRPAPTGPRIRSKDPWHLAITDVFFPCPLIVDEGAEYVDQKEESPTIIHLVAMSINKETGEIEAKHLLENIKFKGTPKYPKRA
uniref:Uncharacterized protein n=1 Tax=Zooxanthella nutricula TaxID=1333877 RepID=A0A7S2PYX0_9DINO